MADNTHETRDRNEDPITGAPGSHPVGTGIGAAGAGAAATAVGAAVGGPVGAAVGAVVGAVAGGLAGKSVAERIDPTAEDAYWRDAYRNESYYDSSATYDDYAPAYRAGYEGYGRYHGRRFEDVEGDLQRDYTSSRGNSRLEWEKAKHATRAAWHRVERAIPGDADRDGR
jgi:hypothetical protein